MRLVTTLLVAALLGPPSALGAAVPLEQLLGGVASQVSGTPTTVVCHPASEWPMVVPGGTTYAAGYATPHRIDLSTMTCDRLRIYAEAETKPTMCDAFKTVKVRYRTTVKKRIHGKLVKRKVWKRKLVEKRAGLVPCHTDPIGLSVDSAVPAYRGVVASVLVLAHEAIHVADFQAGLPADEHHAQCAGLEAMPAVAIALGGTQEDGEAMARFYREEIQPTQTGAYGTPC